MDLLTAAYRGASRNSFNDVMASLVLGSEELLKVAAYMRIPSTYIPAPVAPEKMFVFGAISGAAKGVSCVVFRGVDRITTNYQKHHETMFKVLSMVVSFYAAFRVTSLLSQRYGLPSILRYNVFVIESLDLVHQLYRGESQKSS